MCVLQVIFDFTATTVIFVVADIIASIDIVVVAAVVIVIRILIRFDFILGVVMFAAL